MRLADWIATAVFAVVVLLIMAGINFAFAGSIKPKEYDKNQCISLAQVYGSHIAKMRWIEHTEKPNPTDDPLPEELPEWAARLIWEWVDSAYEWQGDAQSWGEHVGAFCLGTES